MNCMEITDILPEMIEFRKQLHRHPEIAGCEHWSCAEIRRRLAAIPGVEVLPPFLETDTVAFIRGSAPGKNVTLRADIDALAISEECESDFRSENPGFMHACGHDIHTAVLLGAAMILASRRHEFAGSVRLVFQPGEENRAMAKDLIAAGALDDPPADFVAAIHCEPGMKIGCAGLRVGAMMSSCAHFKVTFTGRSGHGSRPHVSRNPVLAACSAVTELQSAVPNRINSQRPAVLSICTINGGTLDNIIPEECSFVGTIRTLDDETQRELKLALEEMCQAVAMLHRVSCSVKFAPGGYPATVNSASGAALARAALDKCGIECVEFAESSMASEDFAYFLHRAADGVYVKMGAGEELPPLHNCRFLPDGQMMGPGIAFMVEIALAALK